MSPKISYCFEDEDVQDVAQFTEEKHIHRLAVLNRDKSIVGVLSVADLARHGQQALAGEVLENGRSHA